MNTKENLSIFQMIGKATKSIFANYGSVAPVALIVWLTTTAISYILTLATGQNSAMLFLLNLLSLIILAPLYFGQIECSYDATLGKKYPLSQFFDWFSSAKMWWAIKVNFYVGLRLALWCLGLGMVGGIGFVLVAAPLLNSDNYTTYILLYSALVLLILIGLFFIMLPYLLGEVACSKKTEGRVGEVMKDTKVLLSFCKGKFIALAGLLFLPLVLLSIPVFYYTFAQKAVPLLLAAGLDMVRFFVAMPIFYGAIAVFHNNHKPEQPEQDTIQEPYIL